MDAYSKEKTFLTLFQVWKTEWKTQKISHIPDAVCFFADLTELFQELTIQIRGTTHPAIQKIYQKSLDNIDYMWRDLLDIREDKIRCAAHNQIILEEAHLLPFEITFYHQLFTAYRGYSKSRKMREDRIETKMPFSTTIPNIASSSLFLSEEETRIKEETAEKQINVVIHDNIQSQNEESQIQVPKNLEIQEQSSKEIIYNTVRIISPIGSFVGADFKIYGPCQPEDILNVPHQNAAILIDELYAKLLNI